MEGTFPRSTGAAVRPSIFRNLIVSATIAIAIATALLAVPALTGAGTATSPADGSYGQVEKTRLLFGATAPQDASYDQVENTRLLFGASTRQDTSYDQVENTRLQVVLPMASADHSYDDVERLRSQAGS